MSTDLLLKFPGLKYSQIEVENIEVRYTSTFIAGTGFAFGTATSYLSADAFYLDPSYYYYLDYLNVNSTLNDADFVEAVNTTFNPAGFSLQLLQNLQNSNILYKPFTFSTFRQNVPMNIYFSTNRGAGINDNKELLQFTLKGALSLTPAIILLGLTTIDILIQTTIYKISDLNFIGQQFRK